MCGGAKRAKLCYFCKFLPNLAVPVAGVSPPSFCSDLVKLQVDLARLDQADATLEDDPFA